LFSADQLCQLLSTTQRKQLSIFISYARADGRLEADRIYDALCQHGIRAWRDKRDLTPYQDFTAEIESAIASASHVVVCLTALSKN
jgi:hypothetical protein